MRCYWMTIVLCTLLNGCHGIHNGATELYNSMVPSLLQETQVNGSVNEARGGGRRADNTAQIDQSQLGCRELRSTKYISDGQCTSLRPVKELVCTGECLPAHLMPNLIGGGYWARRDASKWRCMTEHVRTQRVKLCCQGGSTRTYKVATVTSCTCKRLKRQHNKSELKPLPPKSTLKKRRRANAGE